MHTLVKQIYILFSVNNTNFINNTNYMFMCALTKVCTLQDLYFNVFPVNSQNTKQMLLRIIILNIHYFTFYKKKNPKRTLIHPTKLKKEKSKLKEFVHLMPNRNVNVSCRVKSEIQSSLCKQIPCHIFVVRLFTCTQALYFEPNCLMYIFVQSARNYLWPRFFFVPTD